MSKTLSGDPLIELNPAWRKRFHRGESPFHMVGLESSLQELKALQLIYSHEMCAFALQPQGSEFWQPPAILEVDLEPQMRPQPQPVL